MIKFTKKLFLLLILSTTSCGFKKNSFENYQESINETLNPISSKLKQVQNIYDVKDMMGCGHMIELSNWYLYKLKDKSERWGRDRNWREASGVISYSGFALDSSARESSPYLSQNPDYHIVYIGPWQYAKRIGKEIRFVAWQHKDYKNPPRLNYHGTLRYQFESKNSENQKVKERAFNLLLDGKPEKGSICNTKWIANHGYNAISKVKSNNPFSKNHLVPTGEIIEVKE